MIVSTQICWAPKGGNSADDYEDAYWPPKSCERRRSSCQRFAVADGATESSFSGLWARQLVRAYCKQGWSSEAELPARLPALQQSWQQEVEGRPLPWYAEEKVRSGAFATLCGLTLQDHVGARGQGNWRALALGDSCLFQVRQGRLLTGFPIEDAGAFGNAPVLLCSRPGPNRAALEVVRTQSGFWQEGDEFLLMTDALAAWFLRQPGHSAPLPGPESFAGWIGDLRSRRELRNDDVTLVRVVIESASEGNEETPPGGPADRMPEGAENERRKHRADGMRRAPAKTEGAEVPRTKTGRGSGPRVRGGRSH